MKLIDTAGMEAGYLTDELLSRLKNEDRMAYACNPDTAEWLRKEGLRVIYAGSDADNGLDGIGIGSGHMTLLRPGEEILSQVPEGKLRAGVDYAVRVGKPEDAESGIAHWELRIISAESLVEAILSEINGTLFIPSCEYIEEVFISTGFEAQAIPSSIIGLFNPCADWVSGALYHVNKGNLRQAETILRECMDANLLTHNRLTVINGLADLCFEQKRWSQAERLALKSIEAQPVQRTPYLVLFKIAAVTKNAQKAWDWLDKYREFEPVVTRANYDVHVKEDDLCLLLADLSLVLGNTGDAFRFYGRHYELNQGNVNPVITEKLLIYAIDEGNFENSVRYFENLFGGLIPGKIDEVESARLLEVISLFMDKEWYDYAGKVCELVFKGNPENTVMLRRWIAALAKSRDLDKAKQVMQIALRKY